MLEKSLVEIRWHGRGGQGAVTSAELLAQAAISEGKYAQAFPSFGPERRGAPVLAFDRIDEKEPIRIRAEITEPDVVVVLDPSLLGIVNVTAGLKKDGTRHHQHQEDRRPDWQGVRHQEAVATVDATRIAREMLGVPIINTTMLGALIKATGVVDMKSLMEPLENRFGRLAERNIKRHESGL